MMAMGNSYIIVVTKEAEREQEDKETIKTTTEEGKHGVDESKSFGPDDLTHNKRRRAIEKNCRKTAVKKEMRVMVVKARMMMVSTAQRTRVQSCSLGRTRAVILYCYRFCFSSGE